MSNKRQVNKQVKDHLDDVVGSIQQKFDLLAKLLADAKGSTVVVTDYDGKNYKVNVAQLKKLCDADIKSIKAIPKAIKDITKDVNSVNKDTNSKKSLGGFKRPFSYGPHVADFFTDKFFNSDELAKYLDVEQINSIGDKMPLLLNHNVSNSGILSQLFYGYRKAIPGVIDTRDRCSSYIFSNHGILEYFGKELDQIVADGRFEDFDVNRFNMQRINAVFSRSTTNESDLHVKVGVTEEQLSDMLEAELEFAKDIRIAVNEGVDLASKDSISTSQ